MSGKSKRIISVLIAVLLLAALGCAGYFTYQYFREEAEYQQHEEELDSIRDLVVKNPTTDSTTGDGTTPSPETEGTSGSDTTPPPSIVIPEHDPDDPIFREVDFETLMGINSAASRWVYIPDSTLDYPVMQESTVGQYYYLWRDIYKKSSNIGLPLTPAIPLNINDPHILFFGHAFSNDRDSMFYTVKKYYEREYFDTHPYVYVYYPDRTERWLAVEVRNVYSWDKVYDIPYTYGSDDYEELQTYLFSEYRQQLTDKLDGITKNDPLLILSCCDRRFNSNNGRAILICRLAEVLDKETGEITQVYPAPVGTEAPSTDNSEAYHRPKPNFDELIF